MTRRARNRGRTVASEIRKTASLLAMLMSWSALMILLILENGRTAWPRLLVAATLPCSSSIIRFGLGFLLPVVVPAAAAAPASLSATMEDPAPDTVRGRARAAAGVAPDDEA